METVELRGLKYDPGLQDENSGFSIVLSSVLKSKVSLDCCADETPIFCVKKKKKAKYSIYTHLQIRNIFSASSISHHYTDCSIVAYG